MPLLDTCFGTIASGCKYTSSAAIYALRLGGNAVDAAISAQLVACVSEPLMTGLNAGGIITLQFNNKIKVLDCFGELPGRGSSNKISPPKRIVKLDYGVDEIEFHVGGSSVASTNLAFGLEMLHKEYGTLPMDILAKPALDLAKSGVKCGNIMAIGCQFLWPIVQLDPILKKTFSHNGNGSEPMQIGDIFSIPNIDKSIEKFIDEGAAYFSNGEGADYIINTYLSDINNYLSSTDDYYLLSKNDLSAFKPIWRDPLHTTYKHADIYFPPSPSQSGIQNIYSLQQFSDIISNVEYNSSEYINNLSSVLQQTYKFRNNDNFFENNMNLNNNCSNTIAECKSGNTTHFSIADRFGNIIGFTSSLGETAGVCVPELGMILNNFLGEESVNPSDLNFNPGDRLVTNCCPTLIKMKNDSLHYSYILGSAGSDRIRTAVLQGILGLVDGNLTPQQATNLSRIHWNGNLLQLEPQESIEHFNSWSTDKFKEFFKCNVVLYHQKHFYFGGMHITGVCIDTKDNNNDSKDSSDILLFAGADERRFGSVLFANKQ